MMGSLRKEEVEDIATKLVEHKYKARIAEAKSELHRVNEGIFFELYPKELFENIPNGFLKEKDYFDVLRIENGYRQRLRLGREIPIPCEVCGCEAKVFLNSYQWSRHDTANLKLEKLHDEFLQSYRKLYNNIFAFKTLKRLERSWPEIMEFVSDEIKCAHKNPNALVPQISQHLMKNLVLP